MADILTEIVESSTDVNEIKGVLQELVYILQQDKDASSNTNQRCRHLEEENQQLLTNITELKAELEAERRRRKKTDVRVKELEGKLALRYTSMKRRSQGVREALESCAQHLRERKIHQDNTNGKVVAAIKKKSFSTSQMVKNMEMELKNSKEFNERGSSVECVEEKLRHGNKETTTTTSSSSSDDISLSSQAEHKKTKRRKKKNISPSKTVESIKSKMEVRWYKCCKQLVRNKEAMAKMRAKMKQTTKRLQQVQHEADQNKSDLDLYKRESSNRRDELSRYKNYYFDRIVAYSWVAMELSRLESLLPPNFVCFPRYKTERGIIRHIRDMLSDGMFITQKLLPVGNEGGKIVVI